MSIFNENDYERTGNIAIDMVTACISWHRRRNLPLKAIYLNWYYYNKFDHFIRNRLTEEQAGTSCRYELDNVAIERAAVRINKPFEVTFYT